MYFKPTPSIRLITNTLRDVRPSQAFSMLLKHSRQRAGTKKQKRRGKITPTAIHMELVTLCPKNCKGCYIPNEQKKDGRVMALDTARQVIHEAKKIKGSFIIFMGGETLTKDTLPLMSTIVEENPKNFFYCCTNGSFLASNFDESLNLAIKNNFSVLLSIDGLKETNDFLRWNGSYETVMKAAKNLASARCLFGASVTLRPENMEEAVSDPFFRALTENKFKYALFASSTPSLDFDPLVLKEKARRHSIFIYHISNQDGLHYRTAYVTKDGMLLNDRKERIMISHLNDGIGTYPASPDWIRKYQLQP